MIQKTKKHIMDVLREKAVVIHQDQRCPNTYVLLDCCFGPQGQHYTVSGWAKVNHPDEWDAVYGLNLAREKALAYQAKCIIDDALFHNEALPDDERQSEEQVYGVLLAIDCEEEEGV